MKKVCDTRGLRVVVVTAPFVEIVGQIVHPRVPHAVLIVDKDNVGVTELQQNVVFLHVTVRDDRSVCWDERAKPDLITFP